MLIGLGSAARRSGSRNQHAGGPYDKCSSWTFSAVAGIHRNTVSNVETGRYGGDPEALAAIKRALEAAGVEFINGKRPGVKLRKS
jgi:hypothetical protein